MSSVAVGRGASEPRPAPLTWSIRMDDFMFPGESGSELESGDDVIWSESQFESSTLHDQSPRSPRSALCLGFHGRKILTEHALYWAWDGINDPRYKSKTSIHADYRTPIEFDIVRAAFNNAGAEIGLHSRRAFKAALDALEQYTDRLIQAWHKPLRQQIALTLDDPRFVGPWEVFRDVADRCLGSDSPLRPFYKAGAAIGDYQICAHQADRER